MTRALASGPVLGLLIILVPFPAWSFTVTSQSIVVGGDPLTTVDSGVQSGNPAMSSVNNVFTGSASTITASASMTDQLLSHDAHLAGSAMVSGTLPVGPLVGGGAVAKSIAEFGDTITPQGLSGQGYLVIPFTLTGDVTISYTGPGAGGFAVTASGFWCSGGCDFHFTKNNADSLSWGINGENSATPISVNEAAVLSIPLEEGTVTTYDFQFRILAEVLATQYSAGTVSGTASADFSHTGIFGPAFVTDLNGNRLDGVTLASGSGFNYLAGTSAVPLPPSAILFPSGLAALGRLNRRRRFAA